MASTNDPVLTWLRELVTTRGLNTAELARKAGLEKSRLKRVLSGSQPMFVEELVKISGALDLSPADMGLPQIGDAETPDIEIPEPPPPRAADPYGNHARQLFEVAFALGTTFFFAVDIDQLEDSRVPESVLQQFRDRGELIIKLEAAYHQQNDPRIEEDRIVLTLSFDQLYDCAFPWSAIRRVVFEVDWDEEVRPPEPEEETPAPGKGSHLRLVT